MAEADLSNQLTEEQITAARNVVNNVPFNVVSATEAGLNGFAAKFYRLSSKGTENEQNPNPKVILKVARKSDEQRSIFSTHTFFQREIYVYEKVLHEFREFEKSKGMIHGENDFFEYPKCYQTIESTENECVFLEDLCAHGFNIVDSLNQEIQPDHVNAVMNVLGKLHAISLALNDQCSDKYENLTKNFDETFIYDNEDLSTYFERISQPMYTSLEGHANLRDKVNKVFENTTVLKVAVKCVDKPEQSVVSHGDTWQNNIMFKLDKDGKQSARLLDWQISRVSSPVIDVLYFIFGCTTIQVREDHYTTFLNTYYKSLSQHMEKLGSKPHEVFPRTKLDEHLKQFGKFGLIAAMNLLPLVTRSEPVTGGLRERAEVIHLIENMTPESREKYNERMRGVVESLVEYQYI